MRKARLDMFSKATEQSRANKTVPNRRLTVALLFVAVTAISIEIVTRVSKPALSKSGSIAISNLPARSGETSVTDKAAHGNRRLYQTFAKQPLQFEANEGRTDPRVKFISRGPGYGLFLTSNEAVLQLRNADFGLRNRKQVASPASENPQSEIRNPKSATATLRMQIINAKRRPLVQGLDQTSGTTNYFIGNDPLKWRTNIHSFAKVQYKDVYRGIDLVFYGNQRQLEYDFKVAPGVNPQKIRLNFKGARALRLNERGDLVLTTRAGDIRLHKPNVYQEDNDERREITGSFAIGLHDEIHFKIGDYDRSKPLVIDPTLTFSTSFGGDGNDQANGIAVDSSGNTYLAGLTTSTNFPLVGPEQSAKGSTQEAFVAKMNATGTALIYSTYLGGNADDNATSIAIDPSGNAYIAGWTRSTNFPTANALQPSYGGTSGFNAVGGDGFVAKLNPSGASLLYSTYIGGGSYDAATGIAVDSSGAYVTGYTQSSNFPTKAGSFQTTFNGGTCTTLPCTDAFVLKLNSVGHAFVYSSFLGGSGIENFDFSNPYGSIAVDSSGNAYVTGLTSSTNFPTMNPLQPANHGQDAFITKVNPAGTSLVYSTYLGGSGGDAGRGIAVDTAGNAYLTGTTGSADFPTTAGAYQTSAGGAFISKLNAAGSGLVYSTYFGTLNGETTPRGVAIDANGIAYLTGMTNAPDFPTASAIQATGGGGVFKTTTGATSWSTSNTGLRGIQIQDLVIDPTNPSVIYAAGSFNVSGVAKSVDGGATWNPTNLSQTSAPSIVMAPNNSSVLYAGLLNAVAKTTDGGNTWTVSTSGLTNVGFVYSVAIDATNTSILYMGTTGGGVRKSTDGGASWNAMNNGVTDTFINTLVLDKTTPTTLYLGNSTGVSKSTDGGATWVNSSNGLPASSGRFVSALAFAPTTTSTIYASTASFIGTQGGVFKSTNGGGSWTSLVRTDFTMGSIVIDPNNANVIYAPSTANDKLGLSNLPSGVGVLKSTDGGVNWTPGGLTSDQVNVLAFNPANTSTIYAGTTGGYDGFVTALNSTGSGLMYSTYYGGTGAEQANAIAVDSNSQAYVAGATASGDFPTKSSSAQPGNAAQLATSQPDPEAPALSNSIAAQLADNPWLAKFGCTFAHVKVSKRLVQFHGDTKQVEFEIIATNEGPNDAQSVNISDLTVSQDHLLEPVLMPDASTNGWTCPITAFSGCNKPTMAVGETAKFRAFLKYPDPRTGNFTNVAAAELFGSCDAKIGTDESATVQFTIPAAPTITSFTPTQGRPGTTVTLTGTGFTGATNVAINGEPASFTVNSDTQITLTVPPDASTGFISILAPGGAASSNAAFTVLSPPPRIDSVAPSFAAPGDIFQIFGEFLSNTNTVTLNGLPVTFNVIGDTEVDAVVPWEASVGPIAITTPAGTVIRPSALGICAKDPTSFLFFSGTLNVPYVGGAISLGSSPGSWSIESGGVLPDGLTLNGFTGGVSGTPTKTGTFHFVVTFTSGGCTFSSRQEITINPPSCPEILIVQAESSPFAALSGSRIPLFGGFNSDVSAAGGKAPYTFSISSGGLPTGLSLGQDAGGFWIISGLASSPGTFLYEITATDANGCKGTRQFVVTVDGYLPQQTGAGNNMSLRLGPVLGPVVTFPNVISGGSTSVTLLDPNSINLPPGFVRPPISFGFNIETTATVSGPIKSCFAVPWITDPLAFAQLRIMHQENGSFIDRTTSADAHEQILCGSTSTMSPFVLASTPSFQLTSANYSVSEGAGFATITVTRVGDAVSTLSLDYATVDGSAKQSKDYTSTSGTLTFGLGDTSKSFQVPVTDNAFVDGSRSLKIRLSTSSGLGLGSPGTATLTITDNDTSPGTTNPADQTRFFVQQHYYDFLSRYPDQAGWDFWTNQITGCGSNQSCIDASRVSVSASFFLSIEFQQTGYLVERMYKTAFGDTNGTSSLGIPHQITVPIVRFDDFLRDTQQIGQGVIVGQNGWETVLENNKQAFAAQFVQKPRFIVTYRTSLTPAQFVDQLNQNAGSVLSASERATAINLFGGASDTTNLTARAQALRQVAEDTDLSNAEFNRAFVLMQYFGYLRRNPNDAPDSDYSGYDFWLTKLNQFHGNFIDAEMVKAFITSIEYRQRFGP